MRIFVLKCGCVSIQHTARNAAEAFDHGYYDLTPAYDVVPSLQNLGYQALVVSTAGSESSLENALTQINEYGIKMPRAIELIRQVANTVDRWAAHFTALGVSQSDMKLLAASIDRDALRSQRQLFA